MDKDGYHGYDKPVIDESAAKRIATALGWEPKRTWVGLTAEEKSGQRPFGNGLLFNSAEAQVWEIAVDYAEAKLKEKNT